jgi:hypothetical protein
MAVTPSWQEVRSRTLSVGSFITDDDVLNRAKVVVLDQVVLSDASQAIPSSDSSTRGFGGGGGFGGGMPMPR